MSETMTLPNPVLPTIRKCKIEEVFDQSFIELIRLVPMNPHVRALILKFTGKMPGQDYDTFERVKDWVEFNCEKRARPFASPNASPNGRAVPSDGISIAVEFSDTEYGRANYSVPRSGTESFHIDADDLLEMVRETIEDGGGIDRIVEVVVEKVEEDAWGQCDPELEDCGDYDYSEHDVNDSGDGSLDFSKDAIKTAVLAFVRERHPELAAEL